MFDYLNFKNKIPVHKFKIEVPKLNPASIEYKRYWKTQKRQCIEGRWVEHDKEYRWIPGSLHLYINFWHILLNDKNAKSKAKSINKPSLRDLEWIKHYVFATARGFSGFELDDTYSCHRVLDMEDKEEQELEMAMLKPDVRKSLYKSDGSFKEYKPALEYLYEYKNQNLGKPIYGNMALNVVDIESRGTGKSYTMGCLCGYNFLFDGAMDYDELLSKIAEGKPLASETMVSAIDAKYSSDLISKIKLGLDHLDGAIKINGKSYSSPISKKYSGTWKAGPDPIIQLYKEKVGGKWEEKGSRSKIHHRSFRDNPFAANGTRPGFMVIDEVGFMGNLEPSLGQIKECTADGADKFGTVWMTGTSGDMDGGATEAVKKVFYAPKANNCVEFDDIFENMHKDGKPIKIGLFIPAWMGLNQFKDELGNTNREMAMRYLNRERDKLKNASSKKILNDELMQRPITHSEAFLVSGGNIFDRPELGDWISKLETDRDGYIKGKVGEFIETDTGIEFRVNNNLRACDYPIEEKEDKTGAAVMWKEPSQVVGDEAIPYGVFLGGLDPYAQDEAPNSVSLGCLLIFARATVNGQNYDELVFEYTARPDSATTFYENCRKALQYYNCLCLYENNYNQFKTHMQNKNKLHLLAKTPTALKNNKADALANTYGQRMTNANGHGLKEELEVYTRDWLFDEAGDGKLNLHHIYSIPLLKELKAYNDSGNFDRAISLMLFVAQKIQMHKIQVQKKEEIKKSSWVNTNRFFRR